MATAPKLDLVEPGELTDIATIVAQTPAVVLVDQQKRADLYAHIRREIDAFTPDLTTAKGRDAIKSLAFKITRTKTAIDAAGKTLNEEARAKINVVDEARRDARNTLDILAEQVRKPLTEWEDAEKRRVDAAKTIVADLHGAAIVTMEDTAATVRERGATVWNTLLDAERLGDLYPEAMSAKDATAATLKAALARLTQEEADRGELAKLRAEREAADAAEAEQRRIADEQAERDANVKHRTAVKTSAKQAMIDLGCPDDAAVKIVLAIIAGEVPNVTLRF